MINSSFLNGMSISEAKGAVIKEFEKSGIGEGKTNFRLKDWGVSRQRFWGCPIPIVHCGFCGAVPVRGEDLPVALPQDVSFEKLGNPLDSHPTWKHTTCPKCGAQILNLESPHISGGIYEDYTGSAWVAVSPSKESEVS